MVVVVVAIVVVIVVVVVVIVVVVVNESSAAVGGRRKFASHSLGSGFFSNKKNGVLLYLNMVWMNIVCC